MLNSLDTKKLLNKELEALAKKSPIPIFFVYSKR